jgi:pilus assembly protein CpaE
VAGKKILVVDPDAASRTFVVRTLQGQQYAVLQADSAKEGLISAWRDRPDVIICEPAASDLKGEEFAQKIRHDSRTVSVTLIALSSDSSVARIKSCLDAGFNEYITKSGQAISALTDAISRLTGLTDAVTKVGGLLIVFLSVKGGTGTSSLCANIAMNIAHNLPESRLVVVDLVLPIGSIAPIVGYEGSQNLVMVADQNPAETTPEYLANHLVQMNLWRFHLLAGSPDPESSLLLKVGRIWDLVIALKAGFDFIILDLGRMLSKISLPLIQHADLITLIVSTDHSTVALTKTLWDYLRAKGVGQASIYTILNRAVGLEGLTKDEAEKIIGLQINTTMPYLGGNFALANNQHQPFSLKFPSDTATVILKETASEMVNLARRVRAE